MNNYCITFKMYISLDNGKIKTDYSMVPVDKVNDKWKSRVSPETFTLKGYEYKTKDSVVLFRIVFESEKNFEEAEKELVVKAEKILLRKLFFRPKYKKFLRERVKRILR